MKFSLLISSLFIATFALADESCLQDICIGKKAIDSYDRIGTVSRIEGDKIYYLTSNGFEHDSRPSSLSPEISSPRFPVSSGLIDNYDREGRVDTAFADGRVSYLTSNGFSHISRSVSPSISSLGNVRPSAKIIDNFDRIGSVENVYENGKISYRTNNGFQHISSSVSAEVDERNGVRADSDVIDNFDRTGRSAAVFENGKVQYQTANGFEHVSSTVTPAIDQLQDGTKTGIIVVDNFDRVGSVDRVYRDGRVKYKTNNGFEHISKNVSPEVESHSKYRKNVEYASNSDIGEAVKFFANGKIELDGDNTSICDTLFEEVESVDGATKDTEVVLPGSEGKVEDIFGNGMARIVVKDARINARILTSKQIEEKLVRDMWLQAINYKLNAPDVTYNIYSGVQKKDYKKLLDLLKADLNNRNGPYRGEAKNKINKYIDDELKKIQPAQA